MADAPNKIKTQVIRKKCKRQAKESVSNRPIQIILVKTLTPGSLPLRNHM